MTTETNGNEKPRRAKADKAAPQGDVLLETLVRTAPVGIAVFDRELRYVRVNERLAEINGVGIEDTIGKRVDEILPAELAAVVTANLRHVFEGGVPSPGSRELSRAAVNEPMHARHLLVDYNPIKDASGHTTHVIAVVMDITAQNRAVEHLDMLRAEAEASSRAKDAFIGRLGHELRNPLSPIATALELMRLRGAPDSLRRERDILERQFSQLASLVDDLLDVSKVAQGRIDLKRRPVELAHVVARAIEIASAKIEGRKLRLTVAVDPTGMPVYADEPRLAQAVANLLKNATKYTEPGGTIEIRAQHDEGEVVLTVKDNGIGIPPELLPKVFDLYRDAMPIDRGQGGLGIDLAMVRGLVTMHGGVVSASSDGIGTGSTFTIRLPLHELAWAALQSPLMTRAAAPSQEYQRILVVDDNRDSADLLAEALCQARYDARPAYDGESALKIAESFTPHIALLDIGLPGIDGYELARKLREQRPGSDIRIIAISGYGQRSYRERSREAGFDGYVIKPVDVAKVESALKRLAGVA